MPTGNEDLNGAVNWAVNFCNDETHGYSKGEYHSRDGNPDTDCSGLVYLALKNNGFDVPSSMWDTSTMRPKLVAAGFTEYYVPHGSTIPLQHGDILVHRETSQGHAYIYAENVYGYTSTNTLGYDYPDGKGICAKARVEAISYKWGKDSSYPHGYKFWHPEVGDQPLPSGAHIEVVCHASNDFFYGTYNWWVYRFGGAPGPTPPISEEEAVSSILPLLLRRKRRKFL